MKGIVAAGHIETAKAAKWALDQGGNAFDAAITATFAACMAEPMLTSPLGGGFFIYNDAQGHSTIINAMSTMPSYEIIEPDNIVVDFGACTQGFGIGKGSITPPGLLAGLIYSHNKYGTMDWKEILKPAIKLAEEGVEINEMQAVFITLLGDICKYTPESKKVFAPNGKLLKKGDIYKNQKYANFLKKLGNNKNPNIIKEDYEAAGLPYESVTAFEQEPIKFSYKGYQIITNPPPNTSGLLIACSLKTFENKKYTNEEEKKIALMESFIEAHKIRKTKIEGHWYDNDLITCTLGNTTHISIMDKWGNTCSTTSSNGEGSGYMLQNGMIPNNFLGEDDLKPGNNEFPLGKPLPSGMAPTIMIKDNKSYAALGSGGSERIMSAITQVIDQIASGSLVKDAVESPRIHWEGRTKTLQIEPHNKEIIDALEKQGKKVNIHPKKGLYFGGVHVASKDGSIGDFRRDGSTA